MTVMGDMNIQIGRDSSGFEQILGSHAYGEHMDNGNHFNNLCAVNNLKISLSAFQHKAYITLPGSPTTTRL